MNDGYKYDDGGREAAGYKGSTGDCAVRAVAIATGLPYQTIYDGINELAKSERTGKRKKSVSNARTGVYSATLKKYMASIGWDWVATMGIGTGCTVHLIADELPKGRLVVRVSKHFTAMIDGVVHDTYDPRTERHSARFDVDTNPELKPGEWLHVAGDRICKISRRCVYGYWIAGVDA